MDAAAAAAPVKSRASELLLEHCFALDAGRRRPPARARLEALLGNEFARRLVLALCAR